MGCGVSRLVNWFSGGAASAVATKLTLSVTLPGDDVVVAYTDTGSEHPDNKRFIAECAEWFSQPIHVLKSAKFEDTWEVWEKTGYLVGPDGARCTGELKKKLRYEFQRNDDLQVFGFTADKREVKRANDFRKLHPEVDLWTPLIDQGLTKKDCLSLLAEAGIELPAMYKLGYQNNNCIGCPKGGMGYWNKIRRDFPDVFDRMAQVEQKLGATCIREEMKDEAGNRYTVPLPLVALAPDRGRYQDEPDIDCGLLCSTTLHYMEELDDCENDAA
jgi:3'-phosphoadenosine 5'-phosphosulfate sulfotransferase (PAPS reductase)/FAD synthetase